MDRLNFNHLRCVWATARDGSIAAACETLRLSQPTISKQISDLEEALGQELFDRSGRGLVLTEIGQTVYEYADKIFSLGQDLVDAVHGHAEGRALPIHVGVSDVVPKLLTRLVLEPALATDPPSRLVCREGKADQLLADLAMGRLDAVIVDTPLPPRSRVKAYNHRLGESPVAVFGVPDLADRYRPGFPASLADAPFLLPTEHTALRRSIDGWLERRRLRPRIVAEFDDTALLKAFAQAGHGLFFAPTTVAGHVAKNFQAERVGDAEGVVEPLHAITLERRITHPGVAAIVTAAATTLAARAQPARSSVRA